MPKLKTRKSASKKFRVTRTGKVLRGRAAGNHFLRKKSGAQRRSYSAYFKLKGKHKQSAKKMVGHQ